MSEQPCANCEHPVTSHVLDGCDYSGWGSDSCNCPFDYNRFTGVFNAKGYLVGVERSVDYEDAKPLVANPDRISYKDAVNFADVPKAADRQVGGDHYRQTGIQPWEIWKAYGLDPWQAGIIKYILRAGRKENVPALQDYEKAKHYLEYLIEREKEES